MSTEFELLEIKIDAKLAKFDRDIQNTARGVDRAFAQIDARTATLGANVDRAFARVSATVLRTSGLLGPLASQFGNLSSVTGVFAAGLGGPVSAGVAAFAATIGLLVSRLQEVPEISEQARQALDRLAQRLATSEAGQGLGAQIKSILDSQQKGRLDLGHQISADVRDPTNQFERRNASASAALDRVQEKAVRDSAARKQAREDEDREVQQALRALTEADAVQAAERQKQHHAEAEDYIAVMRAAGEVRKLIEDDSANYAHEKRVKEIHEIEQQTEEQKQRQRELSREANFLADEFSSMFDAVATGRESFGRAFAGMVQDVLQLIIKLQTAKLIEESLGSGSSSGGFLSRILGTPGINGGSFPDAVNITGPVLRGSGGGILGFLGSAIGGIGKFLGFADGGNPPVGVPSLVGENGPEWFVPRVAGTIFPNGKGPGGVTIVNNIDARGAQPGVERLIRQALAEATPSIVQAAAGASAGFVSSRLHSTGRGRL